MTKEEIVERLKKSNRAQVERDTGIPYRYLRNLIAGDINDPGSSKIDTLRVYYMAQDLKASRPQQ